MLRQFGGFGYADILKNIIPLMIANSYEKEWIEQIAIRNPQEIFSLDDKIVVE